MNLWISGKLSMLYRPWNSLKCLPGIIPNIWNQLEPRQLLYPSQKFQTQRSQTKREGWIQVDSNLRILQNHTWTSLYLTLQEVSCQMFPKRWIQLWTFIHINSPAEVLWSNKALVLLCYCQMHKGNCAAHSEQGHSFIDCILPWLPGFMSCRKTRIYVDAVGNPGGWYAILMN